MLCERTGDKIASMLRTNVVFLFTALAVSVVNGQAVIDKPMLQPEERWMAACYLDWGIPIDRFGENMDTPAGFGVGGELLYRIQSKGPVWGGVGVHSFAFDTDALRYDDTVDGAVYHYKERTTSRLFIAQGVLRFQPEIYFVLRPYIQGAAGVHWFFTNTRIRDTDAGDIVDHFNEHREAVLGYALLAGVHYVPGRLPWLRGDVRLSYYRNASVEYLRYNPNADVVNGYPIEYFEHKISAVDLIAINIGITFLLSNSD